MFLTEFFFFWLFSFCHFQLLATTAAINRWSKSSAFRSRKRRSRDRLSAYNRHTGRWMSWAVSPNVCAFKRKKTPTRPPEEAWPKRRRTWEANGELLSSWSKQHGKSRISKCHQHFVTIRFSHGVFVPLSLNFNVVNNSLLITAALYVGTSIIVLQCSRASFVSLVCSTECCSFE